MSQFKDFTEMYCPYICSNVPIEVTYSEKGSPVRFCLNSFRCPRNTCSIYMSNPKKLVIHNIGGTV